MNLDALRADLADLELRDDEATRVTYGHDESDQGDFQPALVVFPKDTAEVWPRLSEIASEERAPFLGVFAEGLKYTKKDRACYLTRDALDKRLNPEKRQRRR